MYPVPTFETKATRNATRLATNLSESAVNACYDYAEVACCMLHQRAPLENGARSRIPNFDRATLLVIVSTWFLF